MEIALKATKKVHRKVQFDKRRKAYDAQQADKQDEEEIKAEMKMLEEAERQIKLATK